MHTPVLFHSSCFSRAQPAAETKVEAGTSQIKNESSLLGVTAKNESVDSLVRTWAHAYALSMTEGRAAARHRGCDAEGRGMNLTN